VKPALKPVAAGIVVAWTAWMLVPAAWEQQTRLAASAKSSWADISAASFAERQIRGYGDCNNLGYGYFMRVQALLPDPGALPDVRYPDWDRGLTVVLPKTYSKDEPRVLIGIGLSEASLQEEHIGGSSLRETHESDGFVEQTWTFQTGTNFDLMTALRLDFERYPIERDEVVEVTLIESRLSPRELGHWSVQVPAGTKDGIYLPLPKPIANFSIGRGGTDFVYRTRRPAGGIALHQPRTYGQRINAPGFHIVGRSGTGCVTAVAPELLAEATRAPAGPWARFIAAVKDVR
jgi:hypothetical protein